MSATQTQECPLCCSADAEYQVITNSQNKHFHCKNCIEFIVTLEAERKLKDFAESSRKKLSLEASKTTNPSFVYFISCTKEKPQAVLGFSFPIERDCCLQSASVERHTLLA